MLVHIYIYRHTYTHMYCRCLYSSWKITICAGMACALLPSLSSQPRIPPHNPGYNGSHKISDIAVEDICYDDDTVPGQRLEGVNLGMNIMSA